jgi:integrase
MKLTKLQIDKAKCPQDKSSMKLFDGGGLYIEIYATGSKIWRWKYSRPNGKENRISLGSYPEVSLKQARFKHFELKVLRSEGVDPAEQKKARKQSDIDALDNNFESMAREWFELNKKSWAPSHSDKIIRRLEVNIFPYIGKEPIINITPKDIIKVLDRMKDRGVLEVAHRALQNCAQIFKYAILTQRAEDNPAEKASGYLPPFKSTPRAAITDPKKVGALLRMIDDYKGSSPITKLAIQLMALVFVRSLELRSARWKDINFERNEWRLIVTKTNTELIVPLSKQAIKILKEVHYLTGDKEFVFASEVSKHDFISDNTLLGVLRALGIPKDEMSIHGFRAMARTLIHERLEIDPNIIEHQLAHRVPDALGEAYNRTKFLEQRKRMMQQYADYLDKIKSIV